MFFFLATDCLPKNANIGVITVPAEQTMEPLHSEGDRPRRRSLLCDRGHVLRTMAMLPLFLQLLSGAFPNLQSTLAWRYFCNHQNDVLKRSAILSRFATEFLFAKQTVQAPIPSIHASREITP